MKFLLERVRERYHELVIILEMLFELILEGLLELVVGFLANLLTFLSGRP